MRSSCPGCTAALVRSLTSREAGAEESTPGAQPPASLFRPQLEEVPRPKPACNVSSPAGVKAPETSRSCARASSAGLSLPKVRGLPAPPGAGADGRRGPFQLQGCGSQAFPTPSPPGPPRRQTATAAADKPVAVDRGCLRPRGRARRGLCLAASPGAAQSARPGCL